MEHEYEIELLTPAEVDRLFRWPRGRAAKAASAKALPAIFLPDGEIRFDRRAILDALAHMSTPPAEGTAP